MVPYFAYGTTQRGCPRHRELSALLGEPVGRFRTVERYGSSAACSTPGCRYMHPMAALVRGDWELHAQGDVFLVGDETLAALDRLELSGPYVREVVAVVAIDGDREHAAQAYLVRDPDRWAALVRRGLADAMAAYPREPAAAGTLKPCCETSPGHPPPHDVVDPLGDAPPAARGRSAEDDPRQGRRLLARSSDKAPPSATRALSPASVRCSVSPRSGIATSSASRHSTVARSVAGMGGLGGRSRAAR